MEQGAWDTRQPLLTIQNTTAKGITSEMLWQCERYCRAHTNNLSVFSGMNIHQIAKHVDTACRTAKFKATLHFRSHPKCGS